MLDDRVVLVTGATGGIGSCVAEALARAGARLALADLDPRHLEKLSLTLRERGTDAHALACDMTEPEAVSRQVKAAIAHFGRIDALVHCAGIDAPQGRAWELDDKHWLDIIDANLNAAWWYVRSVLPTMLERQRGRIILVSSVAARTSAGTSSVAYNASKAGLHGLVIGLSAQVEADGILVNAVAPGPTGTGVAMSAEESARYKIQFPLGEGGPEPVAHACLYLLGEGGNWISGTVLNVSGGRIRG